MEILVIGIGAGDPDHLTLQAAKAIARTDVFFVLDKGEVKQELVDLREEILRQHATDGQYKVVVGRDPERDRGSDAYVESVDDWRRRRADVCAGLISAELGEDQVGAFLVWGDPSLYDSTLAILDDLRDRGELELRGRGHPRHQQRLLTRRPPPRRPEPGRPADPDHHRAAAGEGLARRRRRRRGDARRADRLHRAHRPGRGDLLGRLPRHPDELLIAGPLAEVAERDRRNARGSTRRKGWIMDTYLLRRNRS